MEVILTFFGLHWFLSLFFHSLFLHRYVSHQMYCMSERTFKVFSVLTYLIQGPSALNPRAYAILHRLHHKYSDTPDDPHSPMQHANIFRMMLRTYKVYQAIIKREYPIQDTAIEQQIPNWESFERFANRWVPRFLMMGIYFLVYLQFAPSPIWFVLLPIQFVTGPLQGAIVNWFGHKVGYVNYRDLGDHSRNTLPLDLITFGELFQNNHHKAPHRFNFAHKWFELDVVYWVSKPLFWVGVLKPLPAKA
ncbi:MAG: fatty acid desaturase [bacterium]|nr:fatty acid desaturase [bacterium]